MSVLTVTPKKIPSDLSTLHICGGLVPNLSIATHDADFCSDSSHLIYKDLSDMK